MEITCLGTCSGTEPMPGRHHVSFVVEEADGVYWFDAGESCSYTAHLLGIDLLSIRAIFISHTHMDHIGGLANLLWTIRKLDGREKDPGRKLAGKTIQVLIPNIAPWDGVRRVLGGTEGKFTIDFSLEAIRYRDGIVFDDGVLRVTALHNYHLGTPADGEDWQSYSFRIEAGSKRVVYSGDVKDIRDFAPILDPCDLLFMETGHHRVEDVCEYLKESGTRFGQLVFIHHGRAILADPEGEVRKARRILGDRVIIADDGMTLFP